MDKSMLIRVLLAGKDALSGPLNTASRSASGARQSIKAARDQVKGLERAQRDLANRRDLQQALDDQRMKVAAQTRVVAQLREAYESADRPSKQLTRNYEAAQGKLQRLNREEDQHLDKLRAVESRLDAAGLAAGEYGDHQERLRRDIAAANREIAEQDDRLKALAARERQVGDARRQFGKSRELAGNLAAGGATVMAGGGAALYGMSRMGGEANDLQADMTTIAQRTDMSAEAAARFEDRLLAISAAANQTREETTAIFDNLSAQGYDPGQALTMGAAVARATTAYREDSGDVSNAAGALRNIEIAAENTGRALDVMALAGKRGNFEFGDMARALPSLTAQAAAYKMNGLKGLADITAAAQIVRRGAGSSEEAATNLSNLLQKIGSPETAKKFAKVGINLRTELQRGEAAGVSALETIIEMTRRATGGDASLIGNLFEDAQAQKALRPLMAATDEYRSIRTDALGAAGVIDADFARRMTDNAEGARAMRISLELARLEIGKQLAPALSAGSRMVKRIADSFRGWAKANPAWAKGLALGALVVAAVAVGIGALAIGAAAVLVPLAGVKLAMAILAPTGTAAGGGFFAAARGAWAFTAALLANPVTWIVLAIVAAVGLLAGAAFLIWKNWKPISAWFGRMWSGVVGLINNYTPMGIITRNWGPITAFFGAVWRLAGQAVGLGLDYIKLAILRFTPLGFLIRNWGPISGFITGVWTAAKSAVDLGITTIKNAIANFAPLQDFIAAFSSTWSFFRDLPGRFAQAGADAINGLIRGIRQRRAAVQAETASVASGMVTTTRQVHDTHSPSRVFAALGGFAMDGLAIGIRRGSAGPTAQMRAAAAAVVAAGALNAAGMPAIAATPLLSRPAATAGAGAGLGGAPVTIHVHAAPGMDERQLADLVAQKFRELQRAEEARARSALSREDD